MSEYDKGYALKYIERTMSAAYTIYKNSILAATAQEIGLQKVWDLGGNVSGIMKTEGSLRFQLEKRAIGYAGLDLSISYFQRGFALSLGQKEEGVFNDIDAIVGDIRSLPIRSESVEALVCADVIEHIDQPEKALNELNRILKPNGYAIIVVPSLYKLDAIKVPHILQKRFSTHENRLLISEWVSLISNSGFTVNPNLSRPLGIASGLLYLSWLNPDYVPLKATEASIEEFSDQAAKFQKVKKLVCSADPLIDDLILKNSHGLSVCRKMFQNGDILGLLRLIEHWYNEATHKPDESLTSFVRAFEIGSVSIDGMDQLRRMIDSSNTSIEDNAFFGNSALLVLQKH